jgi:surface protein
MNCYRLRSLNVSNWDTRKVNNMRDFISDCVSLEHVDLGSFVTDNCTNLISFLYCNSKWKNKKLKYIDISNFNITERCDYTTMFYQSEEELGGLTDVGMVHCNVRTINIVANLLPVQPITIWIGTHLTADEIASLVQLDHITYSIQLEDSERMLLSSPLLEGDEIKVIDGQLCHVHNSFKIEIPDSSYLLGLSPVENDMWYCGVDTNKFKYEELIDKQALDERTCISNYNEFTYYEYSHGGYNHFYFGENKNLALIIKQSDYPDKQMFIDRVNREPITIICPLETPYTEVIDIPRANVELDLFTNGSLHMSDPTATITRADTESKAIVVAAQGDSVVNVSNQQGNIELSKEDSAQISVGEITEEFSVRPYVDGKTLVNLMDREGWSKIITDEYVAYGYNLKHVSNTTISITNFNTRAIVIGIFDELIGGATSDTSVDIPANSTVVINLLETQSLFSVTGMRGKDWTEDNMHELKNINIFEGELSEDEMPDYRISGMRNAFDKYKTADDKYRVEMVVSNCPFQFGKSGRK